MLVMDGNMKNHRDVCKATEAGFTKFDGLPGQVKIGCQKRLISSPDIVASTNHVSALSQN